jgi:hypothetical protein
MKFDASKPHGLVYGVPGAAYEQNGQLYSPIGEPFVEPEQEFSLDAQRKTITKSAIGGKNVAS